MAATQKGAISVFEKLGFKAEALLTDCVIDRKDKNTRPNYYVVMMLRDLMFRNRYEST